MAWWLAIMVVLHLLWASLGMALLIRELNLSRFAQIIGGLAFSLSGYLVARAGFLSINAAVAWLPWILLAVTKLVKAFRPVAGDPLLAGQMNKSGRYQFISAFSLFVVALAMQLLAGHAQTAWYSMILGVLWFFYLAILDPWLENRRPAAKSAGDLEQAEQDNIEAGSPASTKKEFTPAYWLLISFGAAIVLALTLAAVQLLPTAEYLLESQRSAAVDYEFAMSYSFWPWRFLSFLAPGLFGSPAFGDYWGYANYWEDAVYMGLIPFILAITGLFTRGRKLPSGTMVNARLVWFLGLLLLTTFLIAMGRNTPIFPWLYRHVPTFDMFQAPTRISIIAIFAISILAAIGADSWSRPHNRQLYWLRLGIMAAAAITIGAGLALVLTRNLSVDIRPSFIRATAWLGLWGVCLGLLALKAPGRKKVRALDWGWWHWVVILVVGSDLILAGWGLNPSVPLSVYKDPSPTAGEVHLKINHGRIFLGAADEEFLKFERFLRFDTFMPFEGDEDWSSLRASLLPNITMLDSLPSVNNFDPLIPGRYSSWMDVLENANPNLRDQMLNLMGVKVVESIDSSQAYGIRFDSRDAFPRIRWVGCGKYAADADAALETVLSDSIEHESEVLLEQGPGAEPPYCDSDARAELEIQLDSASKTSVRVSSDSAGYLVVADVWYPGWKAYLDGEQASLLRANYLFKALRVPPGEHDVKIVYQPRSFYAGIVLSLTAACLLIAIFVLWTRYRQSNYQET